MSYPDSDAVTVKITIRKADQQKFEEICLDFTACAPLPPVEGVELIQYQFDNCHYASIGTENEEIYLEQDKIPYDKEWPDGHEYRAGKRHLRVTQDGEINTPINSFVPHQTIRLRLSPLIDSTRSFSRGLIHHIISMGAVSTYTAKLNPTTYLPHCTI